MRRWRRSFPRQRPFKLTSAGWVFILYTIGVGAGAINTGSNLLYLIFGIFLGLILASGVLSDVDLWQIEIDLNFPEKHHAGEMCLIPFQITNKKKWFSSISMTIELVGKLQDQPLRISSFIPIAPSGGSSSRWFQFVPQSRGRFEATHVRLKTSFPFGLLQKWWTYPCEGRFFIYPAVRPVELSSSLAVSSRLEQHSTADQRGDGTALYGIRPYRPGENPKRISWKASARQGSIGASISDGWLVREMEADQKTALIFLWPLRAFFETLSHDEIESFVRFAASHLSSALQKSHDVRLIASVFSGERVRFETKFEIAAGHGLEENRLMEFLALVDPSKFPNDAVRPYLSALDEKISPAAEARIISLTELYNGSRLAHQPDEK